MVVITMMVMMMAMMVMVVMVMPVLPSFAIIPITIPITATSSLSELLFCQVMQDDILFGRRLFEDRKHACFPFLN
ncbi:MAG: hypothetical protein JOY96_02645 [Verrucomicrobia bacterium]|nr:hypothetical protein [Verrucomicrobiota bacterium]